MTLETIDVKLGQDSFAQANERFKGQQLWSLPRERGYNRHYNFGGAGGAYQSFWLSYNAIGAGTFDAGGGGPYSSGSYGDFGDTPPDAARITANTLTILSATASKDDMPSREIFGPRISDIELSWSERKKRRRFFAKPHY